jgi:hypothetical protein
VSNALFPTLPGLEWNVTRKPEFSTRIQRTASGKELRGAFWSYPIWHFNLSYAVLRQVGATSKASQAGFVDELQTLGGFFLARQGSYDSFLYSDPTDNAVTNQTFAAGDDVTTAFTLARAWGGFIEPIGACAGSPTIYRTDWQGTQQLYLTARTNKILQSENFASASWTKTNVTVTPGQTDPGGLTTAATITSTAGGGQISQAIVTSGTHANSLWVRRKTGTGGVTLTSPGGVQQTLTGLSASWQRFSFSSADAAGSVYFYLTLATNGDAVDIAFAQAELGSVATSYIPTTTVAMTVSDYSISGTTVALSSALAATATLQWSGGYYYRVRFKEDVAEFNQFMSKLWELKSLELVSVK